ncbi:glycosyltransferase family 4 protein [Sinorhizobium meliloti]|uniref:Glycosyltransferase n=4 Tax=Rhizobium meliloti TaxID=382 RepID=Q92QS8_RHIME|nr:glycosyltransferase family 4 protein [Sinorhizobium meliloti]PST27895.1 glycosyltransferase family 1 protein [Mesorhizobium loti]TWA97978.1 glycosyltransferase involved in cell wall biosynthesis [Ensifer sp. SEMIA 134]TWB33530.1 glycosyltransferase involved in cell wall biosynthesis [Ensifer sp. SEMIA 135]AEG03787.1 glycosyl transferase group 1 [Sinorhizobium meliloti BL225C]AEH79620.1 putative glycosyltransferase protein [Sinorhizobium meliloti SM11]
MTTSREPPDAPLRLLEVLEPGGGGSGRHFLDLCRGMHARGHHVEAIYSPVRAEDGFVRELKALGLPAIHAVGMRRAPGPSDWSCLRAINRIIRTAGPFDVIHGHSSKAGALTRLRLPGRHVPRVYTPHAFRTMDPTLGRGGRLIYGAIETLLARFFTDHLVTVSGDEFAHALSIGISGKGMSVIVNGVDTPSPDMAQTVRASFGIPADAFVFGFIGRLSAQKAPERLLNAFGKAASAVRNSHVVMIGSGELEEEVRAAIAASGLQNRIHLTSAFTGPQAVPAFDLLVMPSRYEAMSYVMLEAAAAGRPIIISDVGGAGTAVDHGENGYIVPNSEDVSPLARAMIAAADPDMFRHLAGAAAARRDRFTLKRMLDETEEVYRRMAAQRRRQQSVRSNQEDWKPTEMMKAAQSLHGG